MRFLFPPPNLKFYPQPRDEAMLAAKTGRKYIPGKASEDIRSGIIDAIVQTGGDYTSGFFVGNYSDVARKFNVSRQTVKNVWQKFVHSGEIGPRDKKGAQNPAHLTGPELELIAFLKQDTPSMPLSKIYDVVNTYCNKPRCSEEDVLWSNDLDANL